MKPYRSLTRRGRLRRMRKLAEEALALYQMGETRLRFLRYFANITYRVDLPGADGLADDHTPYLPGRYLLRVLASGNWDYARSELTWLAALSGEGGLAVPAPVPTPEGDLLAQVSTPGIPDGRLVSLMRWVDGRKPGAGLTLARFEAWGALVARLHAFAHTCTFTYQSPDFYRAMGYEVFGVVDDYPEGIVQYFLKKKLC